MLSANVLPRRMDFCGLSRVAHGRFAPPKGFWRVISAHKFNSHTKKRLYQARKSRSGSDKAPMRVAVYSGLLRINRPHPPRDICHPDHFN